LQDIKLDFGLGAKLTRNGMAGTAGETPVLIISSVRLDGFTALKPDDPAPAITPADEARVTGVTIQRAREPEIRLEFGALDKPLEQMRNCLSNLVAQWGYDPAVQAALSRKLTPAGDPRNWVINEDYPEEALRKGQSAIIAFRLDVDPKGGVTGCYVLERTDSDLLAKRACELLSRRARFNPALDAQGTAVRSFFVSKFSWIVGR